MHAQHSKDADAARQAHREIRHSPATASAPREREDDVPMSPAAILALQRSAGNAVVSRILDQETELRAQVPPDADHGAEVSLQREVDVHAAISRGGGRPLNPDVQAEMETRMGQALGTFDPVRVVGGTEGKSLARALGARALTSGSRIYGDVSDTHTLVHELTHVIQQSRGPVSGTDNGDGVKVSDPSDRFEREAEANATRVLSAPAPARPAEEAETPVQRAYSASHPVQRAPSAPPKRPRSERSESPAPAAKRFQSSLPLRPQNRLTRGPEITLDSDRSSRGRGLASLNQHDLEILVGFLDDVSQGNVDIKEVEAGTLSTEYFVKKIDFKGWSPDELSNHVREMLRQKDPASKAFNVRSRAENVTPKDGLVFTDDIETRRIADKSHDLFVGNYDLGARIIAEEGSEENDWPKDLTTFLSMIEKEGWRPRTINGNPRMIYYGPRLTDRAPHQSPAKLPGGISAPPRPTGTQLNLEFEIKGACKRGSSSETRAGAMGNYSALNYAKAVGYPGADNMRWEWLHLIGSAIGGKNEKGNLVAGSYDANTQMTMLEGNITKYCAEKATPENPVKLEVKATLWNGGSGGPAYIATAIQMIVTQGGQEIANDTFEGARKVAMNKMEYDFYKSAFLRKFTPAPSPWDALKQRALKEG
jgi:hypothetical protein